MQQDTKAKKRRRRRNCTTAPGNGPWSSSGRNGSPNPAASAAAELFLVVLRPSSSACPCRADARPFLRHPARDRSPPKGAKGIRAGEVGTGPPTSVMMMAAGRADTTGRMPPILAPAARRPAALAGARRRGEAGA